MQAVNLFDLTGKVAIITGGAKGIGKASSEMLASQGASVVVADFNLEAAEETVAGIIKAGGKAKAIACNVLEDEQLVGLVDKTLAEFGAVNILVNNVGGGGAGRESPSQLSVEQFAKVFEMNVFST